MDYTFANEAAEPADSAQFCIFASSEEEISINPDELKLSELKTEIEQTLGFLKLDYLAFVERCRYSIRELIQKIERLNAFFLAKYGEKFQEIRFTDDFIAENPSYFDA